LANFCGTPNHLIPQRQTSAVRPNRRPDTFTCLEGASATGKPLAEETP
jgi:hypothetical protein